MAIKNNKKDSNKDFKKADAFLNLKIRDKNGKYHVLNVTVPLDVEKKLHASIINHSTLSPDHVFELTGTVRMNNSDSDIVLEF